MTTLELHRRNTLSALWMCVALSMAFADILALFVPGTVGQLLDGQIEGVALTDRLMLLAAVFVQTPIAMIAASQLLSVRLLRTVSIAAVIITSVFVIGGGSLKPHYLFLAGCELIALLLIIKFAGSMKADSN